MKEGKVLAPLTYQGCCNRHVLETWLERSLLPQLKPGDIIVIDNATFHKGQSIQEIVQNAGCDATTGFQIPWSRHSCTSEIWYLPPYSPDLNKIERWWSVLKTWMKQRIYDFETVRECVDSAFAQCPNVFA